ncbi:MAG: prevent-host-death protein [Cyanobacteria bacterium J06621_15]
MAWTIEEAQEKLTELINAASSEPQLIYNKQQAVAAIIEAELFQEFLNWHQQRRKPSLTDALTQLRQLCDEENYQIEISERKDPFTS